MKTDSERIKGYLKELRAKQNSLVNVKPKKFKLFDRMAMTRYGAFKDARDLINDYEVDDERPLTIFWCPNPEKYSYYLKHENREDFEIGTDFEEIIRIPKRG